MHVVRVALCQVNSVVGDLEGNLERLLASLAEAEAAGCDLAVFPELAVTGYPPEDLLLRRGFVAENVRILERFAAETGDCAAVVGFVDSGRDLFNAAAVCAHGSVQGTYHKRHLPNYAVFDEARYFEEGAGPAPLFEIAGATVGISICEDASDPVGPISWEAAGGAELHVSINVSPYYAGRFIERERMLATRAADAACTIVYVNQVGGQDELVFDGGSMVVAPSGQVVAQAPQFVEQTMIVDLQVEPAWRKRLLDPGAWPQLGEPLPVIHVSGDRERAGVDPAYAPVVTPPLDRCNEIYEALVLGTRDYVRKNGFTDVVLGLSGGVDSSLVTVIAADAVGPEHVHAVALPSRYSSEHSITDAEKLCANLGIELREIEIEPAFAPMLELLAPSFEGREPDVAEENLQGRIRAALLMALANKFRSWLVLICGNKSGFAVGYTTIYGVDMAGGFAVIKDVAKTLVYDLCRARNERAGYDLIPESVLTKPPSAELAPGQRDDQSLPAYEILDPIVEAYVEDDLTIEDLVQQGYDPEVFVKRVARMIDVAEWKRRQAPVGVRVTSKAFGRDRRMPITNRYRGDAGLRRGPDLALAGAAALFGSTFLVVQDAVDDVAPVPFLVARFAIAALVLLPFALRRPATPRLLRHGAAAGVALGAGFVLQTVGLQYTTTSVSAFLTYLLVVIVPVLSAVVLRRPPLRSTVAGVVVAVAGLVALTSGAGAAGTAPGRGEVLTVLCALAFAVHIVVLADVAARHDVLRLNLVQFVVVAGALLVPALGAGGFDFPASAWAAAAYTGVAVGAVAFGLQVWGQRRVSASRAALVLMLEPVVAAMLGRLDGERLGGVGALGAGLILTGILVAEVGGPVLDRPVRPGQPDPSC